jgi:hypothetical protein
VLATAEVLDVAGPWIDAGWARVARARLTLTPAGWLRLDAFVDALTEHGSRLYV